MESELETLQREDQVAALIMVGRNASTYKEAKAFMVGWKSCIEKIKQECKKTNSLAITIEALDFIS